MNLLFGARGQAARLYLDIGNGNSCSVYCSISTQVHLSVVEYTQRTQPQTLTSSVHDYDWVELAG